MEDPKALAKQKEKRLENTSTYNKSQTSLKTIFLIIVIVLTLASLALGAANIALFVISIRSFPTPSLPSWLSLSSKTTIFYLWSAAGLYSFLAIIEAILGFQVKDAKQKVALAYIILGPVVVLMALAQSGAAGLMFAVHILAYLTDLTNTQFLFSLIDLAVAVAGVLIALWVLVVWFIMLIKRSKKKPLKRDEKAAKDDDDFDSDDDYDSEDDDDERRFPRGPYGPNAQGPYGPTQRPYRPVNEGQIGRRRGKGGRRERRNEAPPTTLIQQIVNPEPQRPQDNGYFRPMMMPQMMPQMMPPPPQPNQQPRVIVVNPRPRMNPYGMPNYGPMAPPMRGPLPPLPGVSPYQPYGRMGNLPLAYQPRYY